MNLRSYLMEYNTSTTSIKKKEMIVCIFFLENEVITQIYFMTVILIVRLKNYKKINIKKSTQKREEKRLKEAFFIIGCLF